MALFTTIPDTDLDANSPLTEPLMLALRDNPIAIAQGDTSAPNIANNAFADNSINGGKIITNTIPYSKVNLSSTSDVSISIAAGAYYYPPAGIYGILFITYTSARIQMFASGAWREMNSSSDNDGHACAFLSDGSNMRVYNGFGVPYEFYTRKAV